MALVALVVAFVLKTFLVQAFFIPSESMVPQLHVDDRVLVTKLAYRFHQPRRGDVVVFHPPGFDQPEPDRSLVETVGYELRQLVGLAAPAEEDFIKRIIALPGETVEGRDGSVVIDGLRLVEPYLPEGVTTADFNPEQVPEGHVWVMGDNRSASSDSRTFGPVPIDEIVGRAFAKVWPPADASFL